MVGLFMDYATIKRMRPNTIVNGCYHNYGNVYFSNFMTYFKSIFKV